MDKKALVAPLDWRVAYYVPDRFGKNQEQDSEIQEEYVAAFAELLSKQYGGATIIDSMRGAWHSEDHGLIFEATKLIYSYAWKGFSLPDTMSYPPKFGH